jgi:hypothetical protein
MNIDDKLDKNTICNVYLHYFYEHSSGQNLIIYSLALIHFNTYVGSGEIK